MPSNRYDQGISCIEMEGVSGTRIPKLSGSKEFKNVCHLAYSESFVKHCEAE